MTTEGQWKYVGTGNGAYENAPQQLETLRTDPWNWVDLKRAKIIQNENILTCFFGEYIFQISSIESELISELKIGKSDCSGVTSTKRHNGTQGTVGCLRRGGCWKLGSSRGHRLQGISVQGGPVERSVTGAMGDFTNHQT